MERVRGYFTVERNLVGLSPREMETRLGYRLGRLTSGARILVLARTPTVQQFVFAGSTRYSGAKGLVGASLRSLNSLPHAWIGQRLVKVVPLLPDSPEESYPNAQIPVEQWQLTELVDAEELCRLTVDQTYWGRRLS